MKIGRIGDPTFTRSELSCYLEVYGKISGLISTCFGVIFELSEPEDAWEKYCAECLYEAPETLVIDSVVPEAVIEGDIVFRVKAHLK